MPVITEWIIEKLGNWLLQETPPTRAYLCDFDKIVQIIQPADVLLIEGRSRASTIIKQVTQSPWSHALLYIGESNIIESELGQGTMISPLEKYKFDHIRIMRPRFLMPENANQVIAYAKSRLGKKYDVQHLLDLARFFFPWGLYPSRWRAKLFQHNALQPTEDICSSMIAEAFSSVNYPIWPLIEKNDEKGLELILRNPRLYTPSDFDYSPYFDVIKYPIIPSNAKPNFITNDDGLHIMPY